MTVRADRVTPARYAWIVDRVGPDSGLDVDEVGTVGPADAPDELVTRLHANRRTGRRFRIYDDDGVLYYYGRVILPDDPVDSEQFGPLWDWGAPNAGATEIRYLRDGRYLRL